MQVYTGLSWDACLSSMMMKGVDKVPTSCGSPQAMITINEPGLYTVVMRSNKPEARGASHAEMGRRGDPSLASRSPLFGMCEHTVAIHTRSIQPISRQ